MGAVGRALSPAGEGCVRMSSWLLERERERERGSSGERMGVFIDGEVR